MTDRRWPKPLMLLLATLAGLLLSSVSPAQLAPRDGASLLGNREQPLPPDQAFPYFVALEGPGLVTVTWQPAPEHYLYRHQFHFTLLPRDGATVALEASLPDGLHKTDQFFGDIEAYYDPVKASLSLDPAAMVGARLEIQFQGCADWGFCYPPRKVTVPLQP
ncbi:MAG: hypothetical protein RLZZ385_1553 [Pseudomonadota bacterium]